MAQVNVFAQLASRLLSSINQIVQVFVMAVIAYGFLQGETNPLSLVLSSIVLPLYFSHLSIITNSNLNKRDMRNSQALWDSWKEKREPSGEHTISAITEVAFDLPELKIKDRVLAHDIIGSYKKGDVVWVQGASGTGKSTLMKLLPKFRQSDGVYINGLDIREIDNRSLRSHLEYLSQQVPIIKGTLRDNLFFNREYSQAVEEQMKDDPVLRSILAEKTMDTVIQEGGSNLSGGEKQKIAIARTLYDQVDVMILDEIASNIDKQSATEIYQRILQNKDDRITFIISHDYLPEHTPIRSCPLPYGHAAQGQGEPQGRHLIQ